MRPRAGRLECSLSGWMSQVCIQSTIVVFKYHLFIQKNNVFVFAFYCAANRSDFFVRGWSAPNTFRRMPAASVNICFASLFFPISLKTRPMLTLDTATSGMLVATRCSATKILCVRSRVHKILQKRGVLKVTLLTFFLSLLYSKMHLIYYSNAT